MSFKEKISYKILMSYIETALTEFYKEDSILLEYNTESNAVSERCIVFHFGWHLMNLLKKDAVLCSANIDCEYNRNFSHPKGMFKQTLGGIKEQIKNAIPDLIIHKRRSNDDNLAIFEFKKGKQKRENIKNDIEKLEYFTSENHEYRFKYGIYIELYKNQKSKIDVYMCGERKNNLCHTWDIHN